LSKQWIVGHILFRPVKISGGTGLIEGAGLAPVAVAPQVQRQGIGAALINAGIKKLEQKNVYLL